MNYGAITQYHAGSSALIIGADEKLAQGLRHRGVQVHARAGRETMRRPDGQYGTVYLVEPLDILPRTRDLLHIAAMMAAYRLVLVLPSDDAPRSKGQRVGITNVYEMAREHGTVRGMANVGDGMQALCVDRGA